ncbi:MAG: UvrD-helicase domain-containing protein [Acidimicrobiales bacterium]
MTVAERAGVEAFDLTGPLPDHLTVLEASAGTGKTYALAALATRFVAERDVAASQLCIVSFTEAATAELRGRVRSRLAQAATHLAGGGGPVADDDVLTALADVDAAERGRRAARLERAVAELDAATIATIHGFCSRVVASASAGTDRPISGDDSDVAEVAGDAFLARYGGGRAAPVTLEDLVRAVEARVGLPDAVMARADDAGRAKFPVRAEVMDEIADLVDALVAEVLARRTRERRRTFDTLLTDARDLLGGPNGPAAVAALRARFSVVLIDEFQDTDQVQWDIFRTAFLDGPDPVQVVLVGDPKQSIYRFRGAELSAYLAARGHAVDTGGSVAGLTVNRRSDEALLVGLEHLLAGYEFGAAQVAFTSVDAAEPGAPSPFDGGAGDQGGALQLRCLPDGLPNTAEARAQVVPDFVAEVIRLLDHATITRDGERRSLRPSDLGVLVRSNADAARYAEALSLAGVPAASSAANSVLDTEAAIEWRILLTALERPTSPRTVRAALVGWFVGLSAVELDALDDDGLGAHMEVLRSWATCLTDGGLPSLLAEVRGAGLAPRVLARAGGERDLTDLDHIAELLQRSTGGRPVGPSALLATLTGLAAPSPFGTADDEVAADLLVRRIDRDDDTVKVLTVHAAKGLEFPVVLCPTLWTRTGGRVGVRHAWDGEVRRIDTSTLAGDAIGGHSSKLFKVVKDQDAAEREGEARRVLYVALTRARHRLVLWWSDKGAGAPLAKLLTHAGGGTIDLDALAGRSDGSITRVDVQRSGPAPHRRGHDGSAADLDVATATRTLDHRWRTWSFTAVQGAAAAAAALASPTAAPTATSPEPPQEGGNDEGPAGAAADGIGPDDLPATGAGPALPLLALAGGKAFGTLVHAVLEDVDLAADDLDDELRRICAERLAYRPLGRQLDADALAEALGVALRAPLGGPMGDRPLAGLSRSDRLDELAFDLPLAGFDAAAIGAVLAHHLPADDPFRPWAEQAAAGALAVDVAGWLTGSIDLVARCSATGPYWLADYKTNRLPEGSAYGRADLVDAMVHSGYPLQATLYLVALHRYLRWRLTPGGYDPEHHLAGSAYLFLRGMDPDRTAADARGVLWWRPPTAALDALDRLFAGGGAP